MITEMSKPVALSALLLLAACATAPIEENTSGNTSGNVVDVGIVDLEGDVYHPMTPEGVASVIIFVTVDCPIANSYAPEIQSILRNYGDQPLDFYLVHVDPDVTVEAARSHASDFSLSCAILMDPAQQLVRAVGATVTPEAVVILEDGTLAYRGRIDNWYGDLGRKRPRATRHELRAALEAVLDGQPVPVARTEAVGCFIPEIF